VSTKPNLTQEQRSNLVELCNRLESGKIKQGYGRLAFQDGKRCCLGVACDIVLEQLGKKWKPSNLYNEDFLSYPDELEEKTTLPYKVMKDFGMNDVHGFELIIDEKKRKMSSHNDQFISFKRIAKAIREQIL
jgi:hypothetical protein